MGKGIFITGTDTGVGKTYVAAGLIRAMKESGIQVCPMKPVETGCRVRKGELVPADANRLIRSAGIHEPLNLINPYRMKQPLAPAVAAESEGIRIRREKILSAYRRISHKYEMTVVEGAGGIMVPVHKKYLFLDLISDMNLPVLIVSRPGLGTINHTLLTISAAQNAGIIVLGVILNDPSGTKKDMSQKSNPDVIKKLGGVPVFGTIPFSSKKDTHSFGKLSAVIMEIAAADISSYIADSGSTGELFDI